jgi:hypothetical protein
LCVSTDSIDGRCILRKANVVCSVWGWEWSYMLGFCDWFWMWWWWFTCYKVTLFAQLFLSGMNLFFNYLTHFQDRVQQLQLIVFSLGLNVYVSSCSPMGIAIFYLFIWEFRVRLILWFQNVRFENTIFENIIKHLVKSQFNI